MGWFEERSGLDGTVAVVTGGAGGLGRGITLDLAENGVRLGVIDIDNEAVDLLRRSFQDGGYDAFVHLGDTRDPANLVSLFEEVDQRWGRLDTLVNGVGGTFQAEFSDTDPKGWDALLRTNLLHVFHVCSMAIPKMRAGGKGGSIINLTTVEAQRAAPGFAVYGAAKAAVEHLARTLAVELGPDGIRVNNVAPDYTPTPNMQKIVAGENHLDAPLFAQIRLPMAREGRVSDTSNCVVFLASHLASYVTGSTIHPDGGTLASGGWFNWPGIGWDMVPKSVAATFSAELRLEGTSTNPQATPCSRE